MGRVPNGSLVHPRGAVGVVTRTPVVEGENFIVHFPDGCQKSLERSELELLKLSKTGWVMDHKRSISMWNPPSFTAAWLVLVRMD